MARLLISADPSFQASSECSKDGLASPKWQEHSSTSDPRTGRAFGITINNEKIAGIRALIRSPCLINQHREMSPSLAAKTEVHEHLIVR